MRQELVADEDSEDESSSRSTKDNYDDEGFTKIDRIKICFSFGSLGLLLHSFFSVVLSGSQDILAGTFIPTSTILASHVGTMVIVTSFLPWCMQKIPYFWRTLVVFFAMATGTLLLITVDSVYVKIIGVSLNALAHGLGEISFLALTVFYGRLSVTSFAAGSGAGILLGPSYYTAMTSWGCISPRLTLIIIAPATLLILLSYYVLDKDRIKPYALLDTAYKKISSGESDADVLENDLSWREKLTGAWRILPLMIALCVAYIAQYITIHAVFTTIVLPGASFTPRDDFVYYVLLNGIGEFITRSYLNIVAWAKPQAVTGLVIKKTWIFSVILLAVMVFSICASYYRILNNAALIFFLCLLIGSLSGLVFTNTVCAVPLVVEPRYREFCMGLVNLGESTGVLVASIVGMAVEPALRKHCLKVAKQQKLCYTRHDVHRWGSSVCSR